MLEGGTGGGGWCNKSKGRPPCLYWLFAFGIFTMFFLGILFNTCCDFCVHLSWDIISLHLLDWIAVVLADCLLNTEGQACLRGPKGGS